MCVCVCGGGGGGGGGGAQDIRLGGGIELQITRDTIQRAIKL